MSQLNKDLYDFIIENKSKITDEWLSKQVLEDPEYISLSSEMYLRSENGALIEAVASIYIQDKEGYRNYIENRAEIVAKKRAVESFPLYESIRSFRRVRKIMWKFVQTFIEQNDNTVTIKEVSLWSDNMNSAFDYIIESFAQYHHDHTKQILMSQQALITELSSPVIPVKEGIGVLPLVGDIDFQRAKVILESTLEQCTNKKLTKIFIDLSAVPILDKIVAQQLYQLLTALKLIGVEPIFSGIRPELAQIAISLGIDFTNVQTYSSLSRALEVHTK
ncbi:STAS domain-containing protein [Psychrobacillus sp. NPDC058041]|uniref:STAS domain-containing protein n=1 Tax=Psychrobacillus sp. NPDC058041 TaxID=3346310 RepID=UPI0036DAF6A8